MTSVSTPDSERHKPGLGWRMLAAVIQGILVLAVLGGGAYLAYHLVKTGPKAERKPPPRRAVLVEVETVRASAEQVTVHAMGTVGAAREIDLQARVSGEIVELSAECIPGGHFDEGDVIAKIDRADYKLAVDQQTAEIKRLAAVVEQRKSEVAEREIAVLQSESTIVQSDAALAIERGQQAVAKQEYALLGKTVKEEDRALILRMPQLRSAEATCKAARAARDAALAMKKSAKAISEAAEASKAAADVALKKAELDLKRTTIDAPFNAIVEARSVNLGSQVTPTSHLVKLIGTDEYWVEASLPVDQLKWVRIPRRRGDKGSPVRVYDEAAWGPDAHRTGTVLRLASGLESEGRMARLLIAIPDPLALEKPNAGKPILLLGSYVRVEIDGIEVQDVIAVPWDRLHDGDYVWVMDAEKKLDIRQVTVQFRGRQRVLIADGITDGEQVVVTDLAAPIQGMLLRTEQEKDAVPAEEGAR